MSYELAKEEVIIVEKVVYYGKLSKKHKLVLTDKNLLFEREKGFFKKTYKVVDRISLNSIKVYKDTVQIRQRNKKMSIQSSEKNFSFECESVVDATLIKEKIVGLRTDSNILNRTTKLVNKVGKVIKDATILTGAVISIPLGIKALGENKDKIVEVATTLFSKK